MGERQLAVKEWLATNQQEMIRCPYQPGNLMISKNACSKRYFMGRQEDYQDLLKGDVFNYAYKRGLSLCRECPIGKQLSLSPPANKSHTRLRARSNRSNRAWKFGFQKTA